MSKPTPGPWKVVSLEMGRYGVLEDGYVILGPGGPLPIARLINKSEANALLIASAPDLLEALIEITDFLDDFYEYGPGDPELEEITKARAAIAKAKGGTP